MSEAVREVPKKARPQFTNIHVTELSNYRLPLAALVSILHRISGFLMFALLPFVLYMMELSIRSEISFARFQGVASLWYVKLVLLALVWGYMQHFCAGVRHLFMDVHCAIEKDSARKTASAVLIVSLGLTALVGLKLFGVF
ncbi:MAG TPA: succinate dehydrogenase, cytochrome b556 subunit [Janthinobacterium sp.]|nr:succinate dehydrogenase, cytochrome b556 subunit [Janthinobacterium sp.]